ncbi:MAG: hypothetical protein Q7R89_03180 [bacterium]|nr:hypothetical protein [bacterium]
MTSIAIFSISGLAIILLVATKRLELKRKQDFFVLGVISKGNIHIRKFYHRVVHFYSEGKEQTLFIFKKQIPKHFKNSLNKLLTLLKKKREQYVVSMRGSRLLKKSDGISEFFKNMSDVEKGNGEIHDVYEDASPNDPRQNDPVGLGSVGRGSQDDKKEVD